MSWRKRGVREGGEEECYYNSTKYTDKNHKFFPV